MLKVTVIGNIGKDAEYKEFNGNKFIAFNVAATKRYRDAQGNSHTKTTWVSCLKRGESNVIDYLKKGAQVYVEGEFSVRTYSTQQGIQAGVDCLVDKLELLGSKPQDNAQQGAQTAEAASAAPAQAAPTAEGENDGLPF